MSWFISKNNSLNIPIKLKKIYHPMKNNWVSRLEYFNDDELMPLVIGDSISIINDEVELHYIGIIREKLTDNYKTYLVITGRFANGKKLYTSQSITSPDKTVLQKIFEYTKSDSDSIEIAKELTANGILVSSEFNGEVILGSVLADDKTMAKLSAKTRNFVQNAGLTAMEEIAVLQLDLSVSPTSSIIIGEHTEVFDIEKYKLEAISISSNYIEVPIQAFKLSNNISAIEYTETSTIIWL